MQMKPRAYKSVLAERRVPASFSQNDRDTDSLTECIQGDQAGSSISINELHYVDINQPDSRG